MMAVNFQFIVMLFGALFFCVVHVSSEPAAAPIPPQGSCPESRPEEKPYDNCDGEEQITSSQYYDRADDIPDKPELLENTNRICDLRSRCGYLMYDEKTRRVQEPFVKYCHCPEGLACVRFGENKRNNFFYYKCAILTGFEHGWDIGDASSLGGVYFEPKKDAARAHEKDQEDTEVHMDTETFKEKLEELAREKVV